MRCSTLLLSVTLFYSLSFVYAIPHDVDEKRHWRHKRQDPSGGPSVSTSSPVVVRPTASGGGSSSDLSPTPSPSPSTSPPPSSASSPPTDTSQQPLVSPSSTSSSSSSSTPPSQTSSSSSSSSSSTTGSTTSTSTYSTITNRPGSGQSSTSNRRFSSTLNVPSDTQSAGGNIETGAGSGSSFLKNKAAMGVVFSIVGLVVVSAIVGAFLVLKKARRRRDEDELDTYFEKFPANNSNNPNNGGNDYGLGPSATDLTAPASAQTYMSRNVHYGTTSQYPDQYPNYGGIEYPPERGSIVERPDSYAPGTAYAAAMSQQDPYRYERQVEDPNAVPNHPFADPNNRRY